MSSEENSGVHRPMSGADRVRRFLIEPLEDDGFERDHRKGLRKKDHDALMGKCCEKLAYLSDDQLGQLASILTHCGVGKGKNLWPGWATIRSYAYTIKAPPAKHDDMVRSFLHSRAGEAAKAGGYHVELMFFIRDKRRAPNLGVRPGGRASMDVEAMQAHARENARKLERCRQDAGNQRLGDDDAQWLAWYIRAQEFADGVVEAGVAHRMALSEDAA